MARLLMIFEVNVDNRFFLAFCERPSRVGRSSLGLFTYSTLNLLYIHRHDVFA